MKTNLSPCKSRKLELHLKKNYLPNSKQLQDFYYETIDKLLHLYIDETELTPKIFQEVFSVQLPKRRAEINSQTLEEIILQEITKAADYYCSGIYFRELKREINNLNHIFPKIKKLPEEHKNIILLRLKAEHPHEIAKKYGIEQGVIHQKMHKAANCLEAFIKNKKEVAWVVIKAIIECEPIEILPLYDHPSTSFYM